MGKNKDAYKDVNKYLEMRRRQKKKWREKTGSGKYRRRWTETEDYIIRQAAANDRMIAEAICRSVQAIQTRRSRLVNGEVTYNGAINIKGSNGG